MTVKAFFLLLAAWTAFAPFAVAGPCATTPDLCCAQMPMCCGHCHCHDIPGQACHASHAPVAGLQAAAGRTELAPRVDVILFALSFHQAAATANCFRPARRIDTPPPDTSQVSQPRLCLWLI